jgi:hypothetical protein
MRQTRVWIKTIPEFDHHLNTLLRQHTSVFASIRLVRSRSTLENPNYFLYRFDSNGSKQC